MKYRPRPNNKLSPQGVGAYKDRRLNIWSTLESYNSSISLIKMYRRNIHLQTETFNVLCTSNWRSPSCFYERFVLSTILSEITTIMSSLFFISIIDFGIWVLSSTAIRDIRMVSTLHKENSYSEFQIRKSNLNSSLHRFNYTNPKTWITRFNDRKPVILSLHKHIH